MAARSDGAVRVPVVGRRPLHGVRRAATGSRSRTRSRHPDAGAPTRGIEVGFGSTERQNRWTVGFRVILAIPHFVWISLVTIGAMFVLVVGWFAALFTGRLPDGIARFLHLVVQYHVRLLAYVYLMRDDYPPFNLSTRATRSWSRRTRARSTGGRCCSGSCSASRAGPREPGSPLGATIIARRRLDRRAGQGPHAGDAGPGDRGGHPLRGAHLRLRDAADTGVPDRALRRQGPRRRGTRGRARAPGADGARRTAARRPGSTSAPGPSASSRCSS